MDIHLIDGGQLQVEERKDEMQEEHIHLHKMKHYTHIG
jgi:hypothetical protein